MEVIDPGHDYWLSNLDGEPKLQRITFVKREGMAYPGNVGKHPGTTMQEVLRALIDRAMYVQNQIPCTETETVIELLSHAVYQLEKRAAQRHGRDANLGGTHPVWGLTCKKCGHVGCLGECHAEPK